MADYDGDGLVDLLSGCDCCHHAFTFYLFRRRQDGSFSPRQQIKLDYPEDRYQRFLEFPLSGLRSQVAVTDWNGDGIPDLLVGGNTSVLGVALGPLGGKDSLTIERVWPKGEEPLAMITNICLADWDGDGLADLITCGFIEGKKRGVYWLRNVGTKQEPRFAEPRLLVGDDLLIAEGAEFTTGVWVADWNADGRPDLIASRQKWHRVASESNHFVPEHKVWVYIRQSR